MLRKITRVLFGSKSEASSSSEPSVKNSKKQRSSRDQRQSNKPRATIDDLDLSNAEIVEREDHCISRQDISRNATKVLYKLNEAGYHAFLVGGGVRDLLLGDKPKDFDISTDATPEQIKQLFRNAMIIGRRFKIIHLRFGREIIEVTTFRAPPTKSTEIQGKTSNRQIKGLDSAHSSTGLILRDNVYGTINEDALRRDFTANALYYTVDGFRILDFATGLDDIEDGILRMIGDPATRYREDPVRLLRAIRFASKLDFEIEANTLAPMDELAHLLESISPARLFDESLKLLSSGHAQKSFALLRKFKVGHFMFRSTMELTKDQNTPSARLVELALRNTDDRLAKGKTVTPAFLYAALLWPALQQTLSKMDNPNTVLAIQNAAAQVIAPQVQVTAIPKRFTIAMREIWELQLRLVTRNKRSVESAYHHPKFRAAYDFLLLREESGEQLDNLGQWWTEFQFADQEKQEQMKAALGRSGKKPRKRRKRTTKKSAPEADSEK
ncbi:MAG: polynucleotide adenylyltransferase PcnB [Pseudohongiellaceae bacterium]|nr:polynucleotide adenylyltransferase PcnB [Pseudohongiellaceae bacterium]